MLAELGAVIIDADAIAREVVAKGTPGLAAVVEEFGEELLGPDGELDRPAMGRLVFGDEGARRRLEAIMHPLVFERIVELEQEAPADAVVVHDIPLLAENGRGGDFDAVIVVDAPEELQVERMTGDRGWTEEDARSPDRRAGLARGPPRHRHPRHREHRDARRPPRAGRGGLRRGGLGGGTGRLSGQAVPRPAERSWRAQAARSGSARRRSLAIASRSSWRTRSAEMPWRAPMSASLCWRPSTRP